MPVKNVTPIQRLMAAMEASATMHGEAMWVQGYRAGSVPSGPEGERLYAKEQAYWQSVAKIDARFRRLAQRLLREARR